MGATAKYAHMLNFVDNGKKPALHLFLTWGR